MNLIMEIMMLSKQEQIILDDYWAKVFALHIGCPCPNKKVKVRFFDFVISNRKENQPLTEEFVFNQLPSFINYLAEL
jgi:hypothetical protein